MQFFDDILPGGYNSTLYQTNYDNFVANTSCSSAEDTLSCVRSLPFSILNDYFNRTGGGAFVPMIDSDFIATWPSDQLNKGNFVKVPLLIGTNTDEGSAFGVFNISTYVFSHLFLSLNPFIDASTYLLTTVMPSSTPLSTRPHTPPHSPPSLTPSSLTFTLTSKLLEFHPSPPTPSSSHPRILTPKSSVSKPAAASPSLAT